MKLKATSLGIAGGIVWGVLLFIVTLLWVVLSREGMTLGKLSLIYPGYSVSVIGAVVGLIWGFISAFILLYITATIYNALTKEG